MEGARLEKWLGQGEFPAIATEGSGVRNDDDEGEFIGFRVVAQDKTRANFRRHAEID